MFIYTRKYSFPNDNLADISTSEIPSADITEDLLTTYQKDKATYFQCIEERLLQIESNNFLNHYGIVKIFPSMN